MGTFAIMKFRGIFQNSIKILVKYTFYVDIRRKIWADLKKLPCILPNSGKYKVISTKKKLQNFHKITLSYEK